ncbi:hypothetical protein COW96_04315, partial [Candidatus Roizmanbacteria bacterium CG22_combo_CG10-13_8_21_14_all_33_16]
SDALFLETVSDPPAGGWNYSFLSANVRIRPAERDESSLWRIYYILQMIQSHRNTQVLLY